MNKLCPASGAYTSLMKGEKHPPPPKCKSLFQRWCVLWTLLLSRTKSKAPTKCISTSREDIEGGLDNYYYVFSKIPIASFHVLDFIYFYFFRGVGWRKRGVYMISSCTGLIPLWVWNENKSPVSNQHTKQCPNKDNWKNRERIGVGIYTKWIISHMQNTKYTWWGTQMIPLLPTDILSCRHLSVGAWDRHVLPKSENTLQKGGFHFLGGRCLHPSPTAIYGYGEI